jgi:hypothetical protein
MNNQEMQKRISDLEKVVQELLEWKRKKEQQQISFPLDKASKDQIIFAVNNP